VATLAKCHALDAMGAARPMGAFSMGVCVDWGLSQRLVFIKSSVPVQQKLPLSAEF